MRSIILQTRIYHKRNNYQYVNLCKSHYDTQLFRAVTFVMVQPFYRGFVNADYHDARSLFDI
jgi:hypothetical protein